MSDEIQTVGWLGTGRMGAVLAGRLLNDGIQVTVWNRTRAKTAPLVAQGAAAVDEIKQLADRDVVFVNVTGPADLEQVVCGPDGLLSSQVCPQIIVDCSTVSISMSASVRARANASGVGFLAAPISGNPNVVAEGRACIVASGPAKVFASVKTLLDRLAGVAVYSGEEEQSRLVKLCHNLYLGMMVQSLVEAVSLAEKGGTEPSAFLEFLNATVLSSEWVRNRTDDLVARDWTPRFTTEMLSKDFDLGLGEARRLEVPMPIGSAVYQLIQAAIGEGFRHDDFLALYEQQSKSAGLRDVPSRPLA